MKVFLSVVLGLVITVAAVALLVGAGDDAVKPGATAVPHFQTATLRQVVITTDAQVSRGQGPVLVQMAGGTIPAGVTQLTVLTDENCAPDAEGVSHCLNRVRFTSPQGTGEAMLRHHHRMAEEPCLAPGETVVLAA